MTFFKRAATAAVALSCLAGPALAKTGVPIISGSYIQSYRQYCGSSAGFPLGFTTGLATFNPQNGTMTGVGYNEESTTAASQESSENLVFDYSNTADTVTLVNSSNNRVVTYHVVYGALSGDGVATFFALIATDSLGCARQAEYTLIPSN